MKRYKHTVQIEVSFESETPEFTEDMRDEFDQQVITAVDTMDWTAGDYWIEPILSSFDNQELIQEFVRSRSDVDRLANVSSMVLAELDKRELTTIAKIAWQTEGRRIQKGDYVAIMYPYHRTEILVQGTVISASNYGNVDRDDWYIELDSWNHGYFYWKQGPEGGHIQEHKPGGISEH